MKFSFITIFPELIQDFTDHALLNKAVESGKIEVETINPRNYAEQERKVDDLPYGTDTPGMIMKPEPLIRAIEAVREESQEAHVILLKPSKKLFDQERARNLSDKKHIVFVCGRYEGVDARVEQFVDESLSLGRFVLMGGEVAALAMTESIARLVPRVVGNEQSIEDESYGEKYGLQHPQYTRPREFRGLEVPEVLVSGDHQAIEEWRDKHSDSNEE